MRKGTAGFLFAILCLTVITWGGLSGNAQAGETVKTEAPASNDSGFYDRIMSLLKAPPKLEVPAQSSVVERRETPIFGAPEVTKDQLIRFIRRTNPLPRLACSLEELVDLYYEEATAEGIRPDLALGQAVLETGYFRYGGDVVPEQNNYAGIGTTGNGEPGVWFDSPRIGVRAHIQHLLVYATTREPLKPIVDPRYYIAREIHLAQCPTWESLSGKWAVPGVNYGQKILSLLEYVKNGK